MTVFPFNKPIVASNIGGFKEVLDHQKTGILVDNLNPQTLASSIEELFKSSDLRSKISDNIKKNIKKVNFRLLLPKKHLNFIKNT